jgi:inward rectifier potassium channel
MHALGMIGKKRAAKSLLARPGEYGLFRVGASRFDYGDPYHLAVSLSWPAFVTAVLACWLSINLLFAALYALSPGDIANARPGNFADALFFSIETLATVGYGVMAPTTTFGHVISATEIVSGTAFTAIVTGLLFVRFSRPRANIAYAADTVITTHNSRKTLMVRLANRRMTLMTNASVRLFALVGERTEEGGFFRRMHDVRLMQSRIPVFVVPWTLIHHIDETSPLHGFDADALAQLEVMLFLTFEAWDQALATVVHDVKHYDSANIRLGMRYVDAIIADETGRPTVDLSKISLIEAEGEAVPPGYVPDWARWWR